VDAEGDARAAKQEDLQILDASPTLLVEVKGLAGFPREDDTLQVVKYIPRRMKEWDGTDVAGENMQVASRVPMSVGCLGW
jgi:hypothetical protein